MAQICVLGLQNFMMGASGFGKVAAKFQKLNN